MNERADTTSTQTSSVIQLQHFAVNKVSFERKDVDRPDGLIQLCPTFSRKITKVEDNVYTITLGVDINSDVNEEPLPIDISVELCGRFELRGVTPEACRTALGANATSILFPYLRSTLSTVMAIAGETPIYLPVMNVDQIFSEAPIECE